MSNDTVDVDELARRAAAAVRDRAGHIARRSGHPAPPPVRRLRPVTKRFLAVAAAVAVAGGVGGFASTVLAGRPQGLSVQPLSPPSGEVDHSALQRQWIEQICVPATGAVDDCWDHVRSEMWPWHSDEPLRELKEQYSQPGWCDRFAFSADGYDQCRKLSHFYRTGGAVPTAPADVSTVPELLDGGGSDPWYMTAEGYHEGVEGRHDEVCTWARAQLPSWGLPAHVDTTTHGRLSDAINQHLTFESDSLPLVVGGVCGLLVSSPNGPFVDGRQPEWWESPPFPWQLEGIDAAPEVADVLNDLLAASGGNGSERFRDEGEFAEQADRLGGPEVLCRWFQARIPKDTFQDVGVTWDTATGEFRQAVMRWLPADAPALGEALAYACGYLDPHVVEQDGRWWVDPPYQWGRWLLSPPMQYEVAGHDDARAQP